MEVQGETESPQELGKLAGLYRYAQVGQCVSSVAHDINNLLGAILAYSELVQLEDGLSDETRRMLGEIECAVRKSTSLVSNLTDIARKERRDIRVVQPAQLVDRLIQLRGYDLKTMHVALKIECDRDLGSISLDLPKVERALVYLFNNAVEKMESVDNGVKKEIVVGVSGSEDGVEFRVWDSGGEIPESERERVFEPMYTTKGGDHLGLGLWAARIVARQHGGDLVYERARGFVMSLPTGDPESAAL